MATGEEIAVPSKLPPEVAGLFRRMVALSPGARPSLREVYAELLQLHASLRSGGHRAEHLRTVWGIPTRNLSVSHSDARSACREQEPASCNSEMCSCDLGSLRRSCLR